jgi:NADPH:quinone reductase-like Zn-dependent oxidoreductase
VKAVVKQAGGVRLVQLPYPAVPGPREVLVQMTLAPINPADRLLIEGRYHDASSDIIGAEGVGQVEAVGPEVEDLAPGDRVIPMTRGNWCTHRLVRRQDLVRVPADLPDEQAAMLRINPATAFRLLRRAGLERDQWLVQNAGCSSVARWVRLLAQRQGIRVVNLVRSPDPKAGPLFLVDGPDLSSRVRETTQGQAPMAALDAVAGDATARLADCLASDGRLIVYGHLSGQPCEIPSMLLTSRGLRVSGFSLRRDEAADPVELAPLYATLAAIAARAPEPIAETFPIEEIASALDPAAKSGRRGRILLRLTGRGRQR